MSVKLPIRVPGIAALLADGYDYLSVSKAPSVTGTYVEITADAEEGAVVTGTAAGPFANLRGTSMRVRVNRGTVQTVQFSDANPITTSQVCIACTAQLTGITAQDDGTGHLELTTTDVGTDAVLEILDGTAIDVLGFAARTVGYGKGTRILLVEDVQDYQFVDISGLDSDWYKTRPYNSADETFGSYSEPLRQSTGQPAQAKQYAESKSPRGLTLLRGSTFTFYQSFWADAEQTTALSPLDASRYPEYQIVDVNNQVVTAGVASIDGSAPNYRVDFTVPTDSVLSNDDRRWRLVWTFVSDTNRQLEFTTEFDVRDHDVTVSEIRELKTLAMPTRQHRCFIRLNKRPYSLALTVYPASNEANPIVSEVLYPGTIREVVDGETYLYDHTIPAGSSMLRANGTYLAVWTLQQTVASVPEYIFQTIEVPATNMFPLMASLRMMIDKFQMRSNLKQAYQDSDLYEYLLQGLNLLNARYPSTSYDPSSVPQVLYPFWLMFGQFWGLNAQFLNESMLSFSFGGQSVTLDYNHTGDIDTALQRAVAFINENITAVKLTTTRRRSATGVVATRPYRLNGRQHFSQRISSSNYGGQSDYLQTLVSLGLLY